MEFISKLYSLQHHYWPSKIWTSQCLNQHPITDQGTNQPRQNQISTSRITMHSPCQLPRLTWRKTKVSTHQWHIFMIYIMIWICISSKVFFFFNENKSGNIVGLNASMFVNLWSIENVESTANTRDSLYLDAEQTTSHECPALMVYLIDSFTYGSDWDPSTERLTKVGLLKCYNQLVKSLPETLQQNICLQIIPLSTIMETMEKGSNMQTLQSICFSVFSMCRWNLAHSILGRHLTGFGPAAAAEAFLRKKEVCCGDSWVIDTEI